MHRVHFRWELRFLKLFPAVGGILCFWLRRAVGIELPREAINVFVELRDDLFLMIEELLGHSLDAIQRWNTKESLDVLKRENPQYAAGRAAPVRDLRFLAIS